MDKDQIDLWRISAAPGDDTARRRSIGFINWAHAIDHYVILIFPTVVIGLEVTVTDMVIARYAADAWRGRVFAVRYFLSFVVSGAAVALIALLHGRGGFALVLAVTAVIALGLGVRIFRYPLPTTTISSIGRFTMDSRSIDRRTVLAGAASIGATALLQGEAVAQTTGQGGQAAALPSRGEFLVRAAHVLSIDPKVGDLPAGDVHVRDGAIVAVGANLTAPKAEVVEGRGMICMPGFVETHWHHWTSLFRPIIRNDDPKLGYFPVTSRLGPQMTAEDTYNSVRLGIAEALSAGVTATQNWAHNVRSPAHADAEVRAMRDLGIRGRFAYGTPQGAPNDQPMDLADLARVKRELQGDGLLTLGISSRNVGDGTNPLRGNISVEMAKKDWGGARELGLSITMHTSGASPVKLLYDSGLLGPDVQLVHPLLTTAEERAMLKEKGTSYSTSPIGESQRPVSAGVIQLGELLEAGVKASLSIDHTTNYSCDCFGCMRMAYSLHRHRLGNKVPLTSKRMVELATIDGARDLGIADRTGSLTPGKRADLILVRTTDINMMPMGDPYDALVSLAQPSNVDTVVVDGRILRRNGRYTALDHPQVVAAAVKSLADIRARAKWP